MEFASFIFKRCHPSIKKIAKGKKVADEVNLMCNMIDLFSLSELPPEALKETEERRLKIREKILSGDIQLSPMNPLSDPPDIN